MTGLRYALLALMGLSLCSVYAAATPFNWKLPRGFPVPFVPPDNPMSDAKVALGKRLFFETKLSRTGLYSCASCHDPTMSFSDGRAVAVGSMGASLARSAMPLINEAYNLSYGWQHPTITTLESQMQQPLMNRHPVEIGMRGLETQVVAALTADEGYSGQFAAAFGARPSLDRIIKAIAAYERTLIFGHSAFDAYVFEGRHEALSPSAKRGMALFFSARLGCSGCHSGFNFSGNWRDEKGATGKASFADDGFGIGPVRVPTLRNIALTAPYMHDGRYTTLDAVLDHYQRVGPLHPDRRLKTFTLSTAERADIKAFLFSLNELPPRR